MIISIDKFNALLDTGKFPDERIPQDLKEVYTQVVRKLLNLEFEARWNFCDDMLPDSNEPDTGWSKIVLCMSGSDDFFLARYNSKDGVWSNGTPLYWKCIL